MLFDVLHGKSIVVMADTLEMVIGENTAYTFITYDDAGADDLPAYAVESFHFVYNPRAGAKLHRTSLAAYKATAGISHGVAVLHATFFPQAVSMAVSDGAMVVLDPWGNEVEQPPF